MLGIGFALWYCRWRHSDGIWSDCAGVGWAFVDFNYLGEQGNVMALNKRWTNHDKLGNLTLMLDRSHLVFI